VTFNESILNTLRNLLEIDSKVLLMGLGLNDEKGYFGTTIDLHKDFSKERVLECPTSENAYLGHALGLALAGYKPIVHFQRLDFMAYAFDQLVSNVAKWNTMFGKEYNLPLTIRCLVGMGWGQGPQHSQNLAPLFAQIPGLQVLVPSCPASVSSFLHQSVNGNKPSIIVEHRWLQYLKQDTQARQNFVIGHASVRKDGSCATIVSWSYGTVEVLRFCELFPELDIEVLDLLSLNPLDIESIERSARKTGKLLIWEPAWGFCGIGSEIMAEVYNRVQDVKIKRVAYPQSYPASSAKLLNIFYPGLNALKSALGSLIDQDLTLKEIDRARWPLDQDVSNWSPW
jgi:pyruvate/2-oxoglutarate/acetoin dehydrogenase E1 component